ncbi:zinc-dependent metalloprotease [Chitinophaga pendula]|uniref:M57 family metalloprotease n=1 Tax=Chitinophaga TaxID=79328 RepID=UPI000BAECF58|nr:MULTISPECIES: M57 family metalloprotease [Chitinophaga]ASZ09817.1 protease [Chitinophaga sp. MD30]UCJ07242.1 zinc-dependent metalloprotease [Chitinophaga pendula]
MRSLACLLCLSLFIYLLSLSSCYKAVSISHEAEDAVIPAAVLQRLRQSGFSTQQVRRVPGGYVVEGDIFLPELLSIPVTPSPVLRVAGVEQYRTSFLITGLPRVITVSLRNLPAAYASAADKAIDRYNSLNLLLKFKRVASGGDIVIEHFNLGAGNLGRSAGFPTNAGQPAGLIQLNTDTGGLGITPPEDHLATVIAHELGHTIGFRHTDYFNRDYSCGYTLLPDEGQAGVGAVAIPGTPATEDADSWMLACINFGVVRPFNANDIKALQYLYGVH